MFALLIKPEPEIAADQTLLNVYNRNKRVYEEKARKSAQDAKWIPKTQIKEKIDKHDCTKNKPLIK